MIINEEKFRKKVINEITYLMENNKIPWKSISDDKLDFMGIIRYSDSVGQRVVFHPIMYRVCMYGIPRIMVYDYSAKNTKSPVDTPDLPCIEIEDQDKKGDIYKLIMKVKEYCENKKKKMEESFLDKFTLCLNRSK